MAEEEQVTEIEMNADEWREALGVTALEQKVDLLEQQLEASRQLLGEYITYCNVLHRDVQRLSGEPVVTKDVQAHVHPDGSVEMEARLPPIPGNVTAFMEVLRKRPEHKDSN